MCHLRGGEDIESELAGVLTPRELDALKASAHRPNYCVQVRGRRVACACAYTCVCSCVCWLGSEAGPVCEGVL